MGGQTSKPAHSKKSRTNNNNNNRKINQKERTENIVRMLNERCPDYPDVETLGLSFGACKRIFVRLPLADVYNCMVVCKEWRSLIDTCAFWRDYAACHYDDSLRDPKRGTSLCLWKHNPVACRGGVYGGQVPPAANEEHVFRPFPDVWRCGVVVPHALRPPDGSTDTYHCYIQAMHWTQRVRWKVKSLRLQAQVRVCLFRWTPARVPTGKEVLDVFGAHEDLVSTALETKELTPGELKSCYPLLKDRFDYDFFSWFVDRVEYHSVVIDCARERIQPCPCFVVTHISPGWVGGLLYSI